MDFNISTGKVHTAVKTVIYGAEGIGKTTLAAQFPSPLFIDTEGSTKAARRSEITRAVQAGKCSSRSWISSVTSAPARPS